MSAVRDNLRAGFILFSDLSGFQAPHGGVIPPHILVTNLKPDLFDVDEGSRVIVLVELTCPWGGNKERSHNFK